MNMTIRVLLISTLGVALNVATPMASEIELSGKPRVIDGDTIELAGERIRLHGIDAPETRQTCTTPKGRTSNCGKLATQALARLVKNQSITCRGDGRDRYRRLIGTCHIGPINLNEQMVLDGWALAYRRYSKRYIRAEIFAKARREGLWKMDFVPPWQWRRK